MIVLLRCTTILLLNCLFYRQVTGELCGDLFCYNVISGINGKKNWDDANASCVNMGGSLALRNILNDSSTVLNNPGGPFWIGLRRDDDDQSNFIWNDGVMLTEQINSSNANANDDCGEISNIGLLSSQNCNSNQGYICQGMKGTGDSTSCQCTMSSSATSTNRTANSTTAISAPESCPDYYYKVSNDSKSWEEANATCEEMGGSLALSNVLNDFSTVLNGGEGRFWIGLRGYYIWNDGLKEYTPIQNGSNGCVDIDKDGNLHNQSCNTQQKYICQIRSKTNISTDSERSYSRVCEHTVANNGFCYEVVEMNVSWNAACATCKGAGRQLARITDNHIRNNIYENLNALNNYWVGLRRDDNTSNCVSTNGTHLQYSNWDVGQSTEDGDCVAVRGSDSKWITQSCESNNSLICERDVCSDWTVQSGICYKAFQSTIPVTWNEADQKCRDESGYLAEVPNFYVNRRISSVLSSTLNQCWIGLTQNNGYSWQIGNFNLSDSNSCPMQTPPLCGYMDYLGRWRMRNCEDKLNCYVCLRGELTTFNTTINCHRKDNIIREGFCYRLFVQSNQSFDLAQMECKATNGVLYRSDDTVINSLFLNISRTNINRSTLQLLRNIEMYNYTPQVGYFNLATSQTGIQGPDETECLLIHENGTQEISTCIQNRTVDYICQSDYTPWSRVTPRIYGNFCYWIVSGNRNQSIAERDCGIYNGKLVNITDGAILTNVTDLINQTSESGEYFWISKNGTKCMIIDTNRTEKEVDCNGMYSHICVTGLNENDAQPCELPETPSSSPTPIKDTNNIGQATNRLLSSLNAVINFQLDIDQIVMNLSTLNNTPIVDEFPEIGLYLAAYRVPTDRKTVVNISRNSITTQPGSFPENTQLISLSINNSIIRDNVTNSSFSLISDLIIIEASKALIGNLTITFAINRTTEEKNSVIVCAYIDTVESKWFTDGIVTDVTESGVVCITNHLTSFGVLIRGKDQSIERGEELALSIISYILLSSSLIALILSILIFIVLHKEFFRVEMNRIYFNYALSLALAILIFIFGTQLTSTDPIACSVSVFLLHYFWLAVFSWSLCVSIEIIYLLWITSLDRKNLFWFLLPLGWGLPVPIVVISIAVRHDSYVPSTTDFCFLSYSNGLIWSFIGPILALLCLNLIALIMACIKIVLIAKNGDKHRNVSNWEVAKQSVINSSFLFPVLGAPWILLPFSLLVNTFASTTLFEWLFIILNSPNGILFFILFTLRHDIVRERLFRKKANTSNQHSNELNSVPKYNTPRVIRPKKNATSSQTCESGVAEMSYFVTRPTNNTQTAENNSNTIFKKLSKKCLNSDVVSDGIKETVIENCQAV